MTEEQDSAQEDPESVASSAIERARQSVETAQDDDVREDDEGADIEVLEEDQNGEEEEAAAVINIPLAISFFVGGVGFLLVFLVGLLSGTHVLMALLWSSAAFIGLSLIGYITDAIMEFPGIAPVPVSVKVDEPEIIDVDEDLMEAAGAQDDATEEAVGAQPQLDAGADDQEDEQTEQESGTTST